MDQTAPENQIFFRYHGKCSEEPDLDRHLYLRACSHYQKKTPTEDRALHNFTDFEPYPFRENAIRSVAYEIQLQERRVQQG